MSDILPFTSCPTFRSAPDEIPPFFDTTGPLLRRHAALERLHDWFLSVVGNQDALDLLLARAERVPLARLADRFRLSEGAIERFVEESHEVIRWAAFAEVVLAALRDAPVCAVDPQAFAPVEPGLDWAVANHRTRRRVDTATRDALRPHLQELAPGFVRKRRDPACLLVRRVAGGPAVTVEMAHPCRTFAEARSVARRLRLAWGVVALKPEEVKPEEAAQLHLAA